MSCLSASRKARLRNRLTRITSQLTKLYEQFESSLDSSRVKSFTFDSEEARQQTTYRSPKELQELIHTLEQEEDVIIRKLEGTGLVTVGLRRKNFGRGGYSRTYGRRR